MLRASFLSWCISTHSLFLVLLTVRFHVIVSLFMALLFTYFPFLFTPNYAPEFSDATPWLSPIFNSLPFSLFTVDSLSPSQPSPSSYIPFYQPLLQSYIKHDAPSDLQVEILIINYHHFIPEPQLVSSNNFYNDWFGIPFKKESRITHIQPPKSSEILSLYRLYHLIPLYSFLLSGLIIRQLVLYIHPSCLV